MRVVSSCQHGGENSAGESATIGCKVRACLPSNEKSCVESSDWSNKVRPFTAK